MSLSLTKGANTSLSKAVPGLTKIIIGLGWDLNASSGAAFDLDASLFMLKADGKVRSEADFIFYKNLTSADGSVKHGGDNTTGDVAGDDEKITVDLMAVPADIEKLAVVVTIYDATARNQNFGMVNNSFMRVVNEADGVEIAKYELSEDASTATALLFGEIYRHDGGWKFRALSATMEGGLAGIAATYGVSAS